MEYEIDKIKDVNPEHVLAAKSYWFVLYPGIIEFLQELSKTYVLGVFSSTTYKNARVVVEYLEAQGIEFKIKAFRKYTRQDPDYGKDPSISKFDTVKLLDVIWRDRFFNRHGVWNHTNTLLIDDSSTKVRFNDPLNTVILKSFDGSIEVLEESISFALIQLKISTL